MTARIGHPPIMLDVCQERFKNLEEWRIECQKKAETMEVQISEIGTQVAVLDAKMTIMFIGIGLLSSAAGTIITTVLIKVLHLG